ncbi:MAG: helix-turn-helix domain-containing protein [Tannerella sp.]|jgi:xylan 1,4-beta-xylosidase|nr:helix-turn-helix domain-containing protein [Tannerella sp.]
MLITNADLGRDIYFDLADTEMPYSVNNYNTFCILYVLSGTAVIQCKFGHYELKKGSFATINCFESYMLQAAADSRILKMHINLSILRSFGDLLFGRQVFCCTEMEENDSLDGVFNYIRSRIAKIFDIINNKRKNRVLYAYSLTVELMNLLFERFSHDPDTDQSSGKEVSRLKQIVQYIENNYSESIKLSDIADFLFLSPDYFSRYFSKNFGVPLTEYLNAVRCGHAYVELYTSGNSITEIALNNGFPNTYAFITAFKNDFSLTPGEYRKKHLNRLRQGMEEYGTGKNIFSALEKYNYDPDLPGNLFSTLTSPPAPGGCIINTVSPKGKFFHSWKKLLNGGLAKDALLAPVQNAIQRCQKEIGFEYIRFRGFLDDEMGVYRLEDRGGNVLDFTNIDMLFDFILSVNLKPYMEFGGDSLGFDITQWQFFIKSLINHWIQRYGYEKTCSWKYSFFCADELNVTVFEEYMNRMSVTYKILKKLLPKAAFGAPGLDVCLLENPGGNEWEFFFDFCAANECMPDFINAGCFHYSETTPENRNYLRDEAGKLQDLLKRRGLKKIPLWLVEWNCGISEGDLRYDTCFQAAFLAHNVFSNYKTFNALCYLTLSDYHAPQSNGRRLFGGSGGLFTANGIPKCGYHALNILSMAGDAILDAGVNYMATKKNNAVYILTCHYCRCDNTAASSAAIEADPYIGFKQNSVLGFHFVLESLANGEYEIETFSVSPSQGSVFDAWKSIGAPAYLRPHSVEILKNISDPLYVIKYEEINNNRMILDMWLEPHELRIVSVRQLN